MQKVCCGRQDTIIGGSKKRQFNQTGGEEDALPAQETDNAVGDNVVEYTVVVDKSLAKDAAALVSAAAPLAGDGELNCPYRRELHTHKKWSLSNYGPRTAIRGDCNDIKLLLDTLLLA